MKKVLIIVPFWPYRQGSRRTIGLAKYLPKFGWQPIIVTPPLFSEPEARFRVIETPYHDILGFWKKVFGLKPTEDLRLELNRRLHITPKKSLLHRVLTFGGELINYPDGDKGWKPFAVKACSELLQNEHIDAIISISPATRHIIGSVLKARYKIPWLADFPDLWSQNHNYSYSRIRRFFDGQLEIKTLSSADILVTVSEPWAEKLRHLHKGKSVYTIPHGFDPEEVNRPPVPLTDKFTITHTGNIYGGKQDPSKFLDALQGLVAEGMVDPEDIEVRFYGANLEWLEKEIAKYNLSIIVKQHGILPRKTVIEKQRESQVLLLFDWDDPFEKGVYISKVFEYFAAERPILATGGVSSNIMDGLLAETEAGIHALTIKNIRAALLKLYREFKSEGRTHFNGIQSEIDKYSQHEMARKFASLLSEVGG
jgi:hypothetical protein